MSRTVEFHRLESYRPSNHIENATVHVSFDTKQHGILQIEYRKNGGLDQLTNEPDLYMFREQDQEYIEAACAIAWRMVFETPAMTDRFK